MTFLHINSSQIYIHMLNIHLKLQISMEEAVLGPQGFVCIPLLQFNPRHQVKANAVSVRCLALEQLIPKLTVQCHYMSVWGRPLIPQPGLDKIKSFYLTVA